jgi:hypothetical protein
MGLRKGNVEPDVSAAVAETPTPPFDANTVPPPVVPVQPAVAAVPVPAAVPAQTTPIVQEQAAAVAATQAAPAAAPVAVANPPTQVPATRTPAATSVQTEGVEGALHDLGFDGLDFGFGSFPMISLQNNGTFQSSEGGSLGTEFECCVLGSKPKWIYKNDQKGPAEDFFYTFDRVVSVQGELIEDILNGPEGWASKGWKHEVKKYVEAQAQLITDDEDNGSLVLLSISPTSITKFSGYVATISGRYKKSPASVVTRVHLGDEVTKVKYPFHPWAFDFVRDM